MNPVPSAGRWFVTPVLVLAAAIWTAARDGHSATNDVAADEIRIVSIQGAVVIFPGGGPRGVRTSETNQVLRPYDRLRVDRNSRVSLLWSDQSVVSFEALAEIEILPPDSRETLFGLRLLKGFMSFFHRDAPGRIRVLSRGAPAGIRGTEFAMQVATVNNTERTTLYVIDGEVQFGYGPAPLVLTNGQGAFAELGKAPVHTPGFIANNILQWCFYYPAVLDLADLPLTPEEQGILGESLATYREGDLLAALNKYPAAHEPGSDAERVYYAALMLSVGQVAQAEGVLSNLAPAEASGRLARLASALRQLIAAVKLQEHVSALEPQLATEFLAASYYEQSLATGDDALKAALALARQAVTNSPEFGFAWVRVAELEFSFGRTARALEALEPSLALAPRNAQALALMGFLLAAQNKTRKAIEWFDRAIAVDSALGNAWLGRGLCRIRRGDARGGREDLLVAAALEPQRAALRSYLGKAYGDAGDYSRAAKEMQLAEKLDRNDPTAWLYSALLNQQQNQINDAIRDLERSQELNENRSAYRSGLLLDQDRGVRSANLAGIYRDAGMIDVSLREAARAVNEDYGNYSGHLFLANSYNELRDPQLVNLRYETPAAAEYLLANLLAPVGAGTLSPAISQQEYSKLFERDRFGIYSGTEYLSEGDWIQTGAQYGTFGNFSYSLDAFYRSESGQRVNNDLEQRQLSLKFKQQFSPQDAVYVQATHLEAEGGDLFQRYDPNTANPSFRTEETQEPMLSVGYHHEWKPGVHMLLLAGRLDDTYSLDDLYRPTLAVFRTGEQIDGVQGIAMNEEYRGELEIYSLEGQQIWQQSAHNTIIGSRVQWGDIHTHSVQSNPSDLQAYFPDFPAPASSLSLTTDFERLSVYAYHHWEILDPFRLIGGVSYDTITFPENFRDAPLSESTETVDQISPKGGAIWTPARNTTIRAAYTRSLSGATLDQSFQLEPSQVAGFNQLFRSIIPESVAGGNSGARFETYGVTVEQKFDTGTYWGITGEILNSEVRRTRGAFDIYPEVLLYGVESGLREHLDYTEQALLFTFNQLLGEEWALGARYRLSDVDYRDDFGELSATTPVIDFLPKQKLESMLHELNLYTIYNHGSGFFAQFEALWRSQSNHGYVPEAPGDDFWQLNVFAGFRLPRRKAEILVGLLNLTDQDYRLSPLNLHNELPRERTLMVRLQLSF